jgi:hypothetical protein
MWIESGLGCNSDIDFGFYSKSKLQINKYETTLYIWNLTLFYFDFKFYQWIFCEGNFNIRKHL